MGCCKPHSSLLGLRSVLLTAFMVMASAANSHFDISTKAPDQVLVSDSAETIQILLPPLKTSETNLYINTDGDVSSGVWKRKYNGGTFIYQGEVPPSSDDKGTSENSCSGEAPNKPGKPQQAYKGLSHGATVALIYEIEDEALALLKGGKLEKARLSVTENSCVHPSTTNNAPTLGALLHSLLTGQNWKKVFMGPACYLMATLIMH